MIFCNFLEAKFPFLEICITSCNSDANGIKWHKCWPNEFNLKLCIPKLPNFSYRCIIWPIFN